ncbi:signal peptidase I [Candidatus Woesearchaeota archaeon]|nr:MAG: signal peptidase I [Candidatus Woesearchaeota archaeon]
MKNNSEDRRNSENRKKPKTLLKKIWYFLWHEDSIWSWIANIIIAIVLIKFVLFPLLGLIFSTSHPIVAVVSGSMEHKITGCGICGQFPEHKANLEENFDEYWRLCGGWYEKRNISKEKFNSFIFTNGFNKGDIMFVHGKKPKDINIGDILIFQTKSRPDPIIHRVVNKWQDKNGKFHFQTKGDHNSDSNQLYGIIQNNMIIQTSKDTPGAIKFIDETDITEDQITDYKLGTASFRIPYVGYVKIGAVNFICLFGDYGFCQKSTC